VHIAGGYAVTTSWLSHFSNCQLAITRSSLTPQCRRASERSAHSCRLSIYRRHVDRRPARPGQCVRRAVLHTPANAALCMPL